MTEIELLTEIIETLSSIHALIDVIGLLVGVLIGYKLCKIILGK